VTAGAIEKDLRIALAVTDLADELTMRWFSTAGVQTECKSDGTPITAADIVVEHAIRSELGRIRPADGVWGEELGVSSDGSPRRWIIDPIDGTGAFAAGDRFWGTQIALEADGRLILGVTSAPALGRRWWGADGLGAWVQETEHGRPRQLRVSVASRVSSGAWTCHPPRTAISGRWAARVAGLDRSGSYLAATRHGVLMVAEGSVAACVQLEGAAWDYAAFAAVVTAAGGRFSYLDGSTALGGVRPALFSNGMVHAEVLDAVVSLGWPS
jgi:histidinol-phosphatase